MNVSAIDGLLGQMRLAAAGAAGAPASLAPNGGAPDFSTILQNSLNQISQAQNQANTQTQQFALGNPDVSLSDAMMAMQKATITLQTGIQVRNKLVTAYTDIMNMSI